MESDKDVSTDLSLIHWSDLYAYILVQYGCFGHFTGTFGHLVDGLGLWKYAISI